MQLFIDLRCYEVKKQSYGAVGIFELEICTDDSRKIMILRSATTYRHIDRLSTDMSVDMLTDTSRSIYRPSVGRHVDR